MSETYTAGGDTWQPLVGFDIQAQTFTPLEDHLVTYIDVDLWLFSFSVPNMSLWVCDSSHEPIPPLLSLGHVVEPLIYLPPAKRRVRFHLDTPTLLKMGTIYAIWLRKDIGHVGADNQWLYDKDDATYPRGHIIFSDDGGHVWTHFPNSDFMFTEFGDPPLPKPIPTPPIAHFAPVAIQYFHNPTSITLTLATSVPCHLTCYYSVIKPRKHHTERTIRGLIVPWGTYFCFVAWESVEQTEPGDTLYHTFEIPNWLECQTKWFTFRGTIVDVISPSIGPIFKHHHSGVGPFCNLSFEDYPHTPGVPPCWKGTYFGVGSGTYFRDTVNVQEGVYSCKVNAVGMNFQARLLQRRWSTPYLNKTVKFTVNWYGGGRGNISVPGKFWSFFFGTGWHSLSNTITFGNTPSLIAIQLSTGGAGSSFTQLTWDNLKIEIL